MTGRFADADEAYREAALWGRAPQPGWQVTGIDLVGKALRRAHDRVAQAGVDVRLVQGDVTDLRAAGVGSGYRLIVDSGTYHDFDTEQQRAMGREVTAVAAADATLLLIAWPAAEGC